MIRHLSKTATRSLPIALSSAALVALAAPSCAQNAPAEDVYARGLRWAQEVAVPEAMRPRRFVIADFILGPGNADSVALDNSLKMLALLGMNTVDAKGFGDLQNEIPARARRHGFTRILRAVYAPLHSLKTEKSYFAWNRSALDRVDAWALDQAELVKKINRPLDEVALFHLADEPGWYFPGVGREMVSDAARLEAFRAYLRSKNLQPQDVGQPTWATVRPIGRSEANDLPSRRLFYWSARYPTESAAKTLGIWSNAVRRHINPRVLTTANWNWSTAPSRWYFPSSNQQFGKNTDSGADAALGTFDWMESGRNRAVSSLWSEDWLPDSDAQYWSYIADALKSAAREGQSDDYQPEFGGYIIGRKLSGHPSGGKYKALSLIGHGAKVLQWYVWGPEALFKGNGYSENRAAYGEIAGANRLIGRGEDLLFPGRPTRSRVAILQPTSAPAWDASPVATLYGHEIKGLHFALMHAGYTVDFLDETNLANGDLTKRNYNLIYVTAPNVSAAAQNDLRDWIQKGGTAVFSPGAAASDEYNTPVSILDAVRGVRAQVLPRATVADDVKQSTSIEVRNADWGATTRVIRAVPGLRVTNATTVAQANGAPALAYHRSGEGLAVSYGFWPGASYFDSVRRGNFTKLPTGWNGDLRDIVTAAPRLTRVRKPVEVSVPVVEAARLDSDVGIAVTLLNWTDAPVDNLAVTVRNAAGIQTVGSAERGAIPFTRDGDSIRLSLPLRDVDVLMLRR